MTAPHRWCRAVIWFLTVADMSPCTNHLRIPNLTKTYLKSSLSVVKHLPEYSGRTRSIPWLLMKWLLAQLSQQQPWHLLCTINRFLSSLGKRFINLCPLNPGPSMYTKDKKYIFVFPKINSAQHGSKQMQHTPHRKKQRLFHINPSIIILKILGLWQHLKHIYDSKNTTQTWSNDTRESHCNTIVPEILTTDAPELTVRARSRGVTSTNSTSVGWFNISNHATYLYRDSYYKDETVVRPSYLYNGKSYTGKITSLHWVITLAYVQFLSLS